MGKPCLFDVGKLSKDNNEDDSDAPKHTTIIFNNISKANSTLFPNIAKLTVKTSRKQLLIHTLLTLRQ